MADLTPRQGESLQPEVRTRYRDMEDTTHAQIVAARLIGEYSEFEQDLPTDSMVVITVPHHEIHEGETWAASYKSPDAGNIADDGTIVFAIQTGAMFVHMVFRAACGGDMETELREGAVIQNDGTAMAEYNKNRAIGDGGNTATVVRDPTINNAGTLIENEFIPGGTGGNAIGGAAVGRPEWILARGRTYLFRITNRAGNAQPMSLAIEWYEESEN